MHMRICDTCQSPLDPDNDATYGMTLRHADVGEIRIHVSGGSDICRNCVTTAVAGMPSERPDVIPFERRAVH